MPRIAGHISAPPMPISTRVAISQASRLGGAAEHGEEREDRGADEEGAASAEQVRDPAAGDDQHSEGERVGVDDPLGGRHIRVEVLLDLRDRDVDRGEVVRDHEDRDPHRDQRQPGAAVDRLLAALHGSQP